MPTIAEVLELAVRHHQIGNLQEAERLYRHLLEADPANADAHHLLGLLCHQSGHQGAAVALIRKAMALNPGAPVFPFNLGTILKGQGRLDEAVDCFHQALGLNPQYVDALGNLGIALKDLGRLDEASACYRQVLRLDPNNAKAHNNLGNALREQGLFTEAAECFQSALRLNPSFAEAYSNLGIVLKEHGQSAEALASFQQALRLNPRDADAHYNLGVLLNAEGHVGEAMACYREALRLNPHDAHVHNNLGVALRDHGELEEAVACFRQALALNAGAADVHNNLGIALLRMGRFDESRAEYDRALAIQPGYWMAHWNRSLLRLLLGDFQSGWEDYEWRLQHADVAPRAFDQPRWDGSSLEGKTVLVHSEQGLGDTIQFLRYLPFVKSRGGQVLFECQPRLLRLLAGIPGVDLFLARGSPLPHFDFQVPLLSLPGICGTTLPTIPATVPYLHAEPVLVDHWRHELEPLGGLKVGIAWQGNPKNDSDRYRSCPLSCFEALAHVQGVRLVSLQKGPGADQLSSLASGWPIVDVGERLDREAGFIDTAAVLMSLDLVVTVDCAVAHLAGALGVPTWVVLPMVPDWRWLLERRDSPWYPTMRLFRQSCLGGWEDVFQEVQVALRDLARSKSDSAE